ncbi:uncharacterized protein [Antedon mediterranea]|uniref:uncharacterized protein n=1 Tax=Antedon mediterranea TaxID=105859 RepID=UPI003AF946A0
MAFDFEPSPNPKHRFQIFVNDLKGKSTTFDVYAETKVLDLKRMINERLQVPIKSQRLTYQDKQLEDHNTMEWHGIRKDATITLLLRLRGG